MGVNRFIDYANPMYWAKMLRKGGIPKRKPYSFTVKINDFEHGTEEGKINSASCKFGDSTILTNEGQKTLSSVYDTTIDRSVVFEFIADSEDYVGYSLSPSTKWKITTKSGTVYSGTLAKQDFNKKKDKNEDEKVMMGLFTIDRVPVSVPTETDETEVLYYRKFTLTNAIDSVIFDGCTIEFDPIFEQIGHCMLSVESKYDGDFETVAGYEPELWFEGKPSEKAIKINEWVVLPDTETGATNTETICIEVNQYMKLQDWEGQEGHSVKVKYTKDDGRAGEKYAVPQVINAGGNYSINLKIGTEDQEQGYVCIKPKSQTTITILVCYKEDRNTFATMIASSNNADYGVVQINSGDIGEEVGGLFVKGQTASYKAFPIGGHKFDGWYEMEGEEPKEYPKSTDNPYSINVDDTYYGDMYVLMAKFSKPEASFTARKKNYYDATIKVERKTGETTYETLANNVYEYSSTVFKHHLKYGDILKCTLSYDETGFENHKWYIGDEVKTDKVVEFMLDETTANIMYGLDLKDGYGAVFAEVYPNDYKWSKTNPVKVKAYIREKTDQVDTRFKAAQDQFTNTEKWTPIIYGDDVETKLGETGWATKAVQLNNSETGVKKEYWVGFEVIPYTETVEGVTTEKAPYFSYWTDAVKPQGWGGAYKFVHNTPLSMDSEERYRFVRVSANFINEQTKAEQRGTFKVDSKITIGGETVDLQARAQLVMHDSQTLLSIFEPNAHCVFDKRSTTVVRIKEVDQTVQYSGATYKYDSCTAEPAELIKEMFIDPQGMGGISFTDDMKTATDPVVTLHLNYTQQAQTEEEFLKSNIAEAKEKLADAIETLEKDYDDGKEDVVEETPVKDEPDTDEADVAEAVLATEPTEDNE